MTLTCNWCGDDMGGRDKGRYGHSLDFTAIDGLGLKGVGLDQGAPPTIVLSLHFHEACMRAASQEIFRLVREHEFEDGELDPFTREEEGESGPPDEDDYREHRRRRNVWQRMDWANRERLTLDALGGARLTTSELADKLSELLAEIGGPRLYAGSIRNLLLRMIDRGELEREPETFRKTRTRYRYFRATQLDGPIKDLDNAFKED